MLVRIDKTLSELWSLKDNPSDFTTEQLKEVATMAINALHKQEVEHEKFVNSLYEAIRKEEDKVRKLAKENAELYHFKETAESVLNKETLDIINDQLSVKEDW